MEQFGTWPKLGISNCLRGFTLLRLNGCACDWSYDSLCCALILQTLKRCRQEVSEALELAEDKLDLSMGMSGDFEQAVRFIPLNSEFCSLFGSKGC